MTCMKNCYFLLVCKLYKTDTLLDAGCNREFGKKFRFPFFQGLTVLKPFALVWLLVLTLRCRGCRLVPLLMQGMSEPRSLGCSEITFCKSLIG